MCRSPQHNKTAKAKHTSYERKAKHENFTSQCECKIYTIKNQHGSRGQPINHHKRTDLDEIPIPIHLKDTFKQEIDRMLKAGVLKPVQESTPWINSFVLIEGTDKQGKPKLCICLDPTN